MIFSNTFFTVYVCVWQFVIGAVFASFLSCFAYRTCVGESITAGRSHCDTCGHTLTLLELVPIFSFIFCKGRCRYCNEKISPTCFIGEIVLAILFVVCTLRFDLSPSLFLALFFVCTLYFVTMTDLQDRIIPNGVIILAIVVRILYCVYAGEGSIKFLGWVLVNGLFIAVPVLLITLLLERILKKEALGGGDIKLMYIIGIYIGWKHCLFMLLVACILGIIGAVIAMKKSEDGESVAIPFGPYLSAGSVLALLFGDSIITAYLSLFI